MAVKWKLEKGATWTQKLHAEHPSHGKKVTIPSEGSSRSRPRRMLIPKPLDLNALVKTVRKGKLVTQSQLRDRLAEVSKVDCMCPMTTGIFLRIVAEEAEEARAEGRKRITPY